MGRFGFLCQEADAEALDRLYKEYRPVPVFGG